MVWRDAVVPQASDDAQKYGIWWYLGIVLSYVWYAVYNDCNTTKARLRSEVECQSEDISYCVTCGYPQEYCDCCPDCQNIHRLALCPDCQTTTLRCWEPVHSKTQTTLPDNATHVVVMTKEQLQAYKDFKEFQRSVSPHSDEISQEVAEPKSQHQNVMFSDVHPGYLTSIESTTDDVRDAPFLEDASLDQFFSRPIKVKEITWPTSATFLEEFNPWKEYFENTRVINRISNYKLLTATLKVKITINGTPFHYGRALASYNPLHRVDSLTKVRPLLLLDFVSGTQRPHIWIDPTNSQGGEMSLPFFYWKNALDIVGSDWDDMGLLSIAPLNLLAHANGADSPCTINVFVWAENVKFAIPTSINPGEIEPQADEYQATGVLSKPASAIASVAKALGKIPLFSPYARATEMGATTMANIASMFGYCRPVDIERHVYRTFLKNDLAVCNGKDDVQKLSVDAKQELTLDPRTVGLGNVDELSINYIAARESWIEKFFWQTGDPSEKKIFSILVDPMIHRAFSDNPGIERSFPATAFATIPFQKWRGTLKFRFQVVASKYHKGRMKIVYDPTGAISDEAEYNTAYTTIVDISDTTDFTIECGWGQATTYRDHCGFRPQGQMFGTSLAYTSHTNSYGNGVISAYIVNELTVPDTTIPNDIEINCFISAGDDFELAMPTSEFLSQLRLVNSQDLPRDVVPQAEEAPPEETQKMDSAPLMAPTLNVVGNTMPTMDNTNLIHFGESIRSFRTLLKRYYLHEALIGDAPGTNGNITAMVHVRPNMPLEPGYTVTGGDIVRPAESGDYYYAQMTLLRYISLAYGAWRGAIRWNHDSSMFVVPNKNLRSGSVRVSRNVGDLIPSSSTFQGTGLDGDSADGQKYWCDLFQLSNVNNGHTLASVQYASINSTEIPYYSELRFTPSKQIARFDRPMINWPSHTVSAVADLEEMSNIVSSCAAGEDFSCYFFLGAPIFFTEASFPPGPPDPERMARFS